MTKTWRLLFNVIYCHKLPQYMPTLDPTLTQTQKGISSNFIKSIHLYSPKKKSEKCPFHWRLLLGVQGPKLRRESWRSTDKNQLRESWNTFFFPEKLLQLGCRWRSQLWLFPPAPHPFCTQISFLILYLVVKGLTFPSWAYPCGLTLYPKQFTEIPHTHTTKCFPQEKLW